MRTGGDATSSGNHATQEHAPGRSTAARAPHRWVPPTRPPRVPIPPTSCVRCPATVLRATILYGPTIQRNTHRSILPPNEPSVWGPLSISSPCHPCCFFFYPSPSVSPLPPRPVGGRTQRNRALESNRFQPYLCRDSRYLLGGWDLLQKKNSLLPCGQGAGN
jgi:hypothetical protein